MKACRFIVIAFFASLPLIFTSPGHTMPPLPASSPGDYHFSIDSIKTSETSRTDEIAGGIREDIPAKYQERYLAWKNEFLATESGRQQWRRYASCDRLRDTGSFLSSSTEHR
jgi:hypothetical protein